MTFGRVRWWHDFPQAFIDTERADPVRWPVVKTGVGWISPFDSPGTRHQFSISGFAIGDLVSFDLTDGKVSAVKKALAVPSFVNGRIVAWNYAEWNGALAASIEKALAGRVAEGYQPQQSRLPWRG